MTVEKLQNIRRTQKLNRDPFLLDTELEYKDLSKRQTRTDRPEQKIQRHILYYDVIFSSREEKNENSLATTHFTNFLRKSNTDFLRRKQKNHDFLIFFFIDFYSCFYVIILFLVGIRRIILYIFYT